MPRLHHRFPFVFLLAVCAALVAPDRPARAVMPARDGTVPPIVSEGFDAGLFQLPEGPALGTSAVVGTWNVPVILLDFTDQPLTYSNRADWERALFDTTASTPTGSVFDYYVWASGNRFRVVGKVVAVVHLGQTKGYYANNSWGLSSSTPLNSAGAVLEALRTCDTQVNWSDFDQDLDGYVDMVWVLHSGLGGENVITRQDLWSITSRLSSWSAAGTFVTSDPIPGTTVKERVDRFSILPELSAFHPGGRAEIGVFCHEFGHALGLPDLYDTAPMSQPYNVGPGCWSLMSTGGYGTDSQSPESPSGLGAWPLTFLGWRTPVRPTTDSLMTLRPIETGGDILELWFQGEASSEHFLVENRQRLGFDHNIPQEGLLVSQVDDVTITSSLAANRVNSGPYPGLRIIEGDGRSDLYTGINRGDGGDPMPGNSGLVRWADDTRPNTRSRLGNVTNVGIRDILLSGDDVRFTAQVRAPGWQAPRAQSSPSYNPRPSTASGTRAVTLDGGAIASVGSESIGGVPQIVLRSRGTDGVWAPPYTVSQSSTGALDPTLCAIPGGDLCVAWSDTRHGANELYFRSRIGGVWTAERRLTDQPGYSRFPALGADRRGNVHLAWQYSDAIGIRIEFMRFTYLSPFGDPWPVNTYGGIPDAPALTMAPDGSSNLVWIDEGTSTGGLWFSRFSPDSGLRPPRRLVQSQSGFVAMVQALVDAQGALHVLYASSGGAGSELHDYRRLGNSVFDTAFVRRGQPIQDFTMAIDAAGARHVVMEAVTSGSSQILYKEWHPSGGWDVGTTEVTQSSDGVAVRPVILSRDSTSVTVLYTRYVQGVPSFMERLRTLGLLYLTAVAEDPVPPTSSQVRGGPNPLRAGRRLLFSGQGSPPGSSIDVFDLSGRRVYRTPVVAGSGAWVAVVPGSETARWSSGVYFARWGGGAARLRVVVLR